MLMRQKRGDGGEKVIGNLEVPNELPVGKSASITVLSFQ